MVKDMTVYLHLHEITEERIDTLKECLLNTKGKCKLSFQIVQAEEQISLKLPSRKHSVNCLESIHKIKNFEWLSFKFNQ
jgi:DNA polymerase-3 subunit alpha